MQTRRTFLSLTAATFAGTVLPPFASAQKIAAISTTAGGDLFTPATLGAYQQNLMTKEKMEKLIGSLFMVFLDEGSQSGNVAYLTLGKVIDLTDLQSDLAGSSASTSSPAIKTGKAPVSVTATAANPFTRAKGYVAIFHGETKKVSQGTYIVDHGRLGRVTILLVPGKNEAGDTTIVATFAST